MPIVALTAGPVFGRASTARQRSASSALPACCHWAITYLGAKNMNQIARLARTAARPKPLITAFTGLAALLAAAPAQGQFHESRSGARIIIDETYYGGPNFADAEAELLRPSVTGYGSADVDFGTVRSAVSTGSRGPNGCHPFFCGYGGKVQSMMWDTLTLTNDSEDPVKNVKFDFAIDGTLTRGPFGSAAARAVYYLGTERNGWNRQGVELGDGDVKFNGSFNVRKDRSLTLYFYQSLTATAYSGGVADFGHTMRFNWELPTGVSYTSASGRFLSGVAAVPEPSTWAMMIGGFGLVGGALRTGRKRPTTGAGVLA